MGKHYNPRRKPNKIDWTDPLAVAAYNKARGSPLKKQAHRLDKTRKQHYWSAQFLLLLAGMYPTWCHAWEEEKKAEHERKHQADLAARREAYALLPEEEKAAARARRREYKKARDPERRREQRRQERHRRRAHKNGRGGGNDFTVGQWKKMQKVYRGRCVYCGKVPRRLTMDHITPISKGGLHTVHNIVPACQECNGTKSTKAAPQMIQPLLLL